MVDRIKRKRSNLLLFDLLSLIFLFPEVFSYGIKVAQGKAFIDFKFTEGMAHHFNILNGLIKALPRGFFKPKF